MIKYVPTLTVELESTSVTYFQALVLKSASCPPKTLNKSIK